METNNNEIILKSLFYDKVTTPTEKLRMIKDEFKLSLRSLGGEGLSKACISLIINGINGITEHSGSILVKNINSLLGINLTLEWLLEKPSEQVKRLLETNIESYKKGEISINDLEKIANNNTSYADTNLLLKIYEIFAEDYKFLNVNKSLMYIDRGIEISFKVCNFEYEIKFKKIKGDIALLQSNAQYALELYGEVKERTTDKSMKYKLQYNTIIGLRKLKRFEEMLEEIEVFKKTYEVLEYHKRNLRALEANSFSILKEYEKALQIYRELLSTSMELNDSKEICRFNYNIADIYFEIGDIELAQKYMNLSLNYDDDVNIIKHFLFAATVFNELTFIEKAKQRVKEGDLISLNSIYNKEIELCIKNNYSEMLKNVLDNCIKQKIKIKQPDLLLFMYDNFTSEEYRKYLELFKENKCF